MKAKYRYCIAMLVLAAILFPGLLFGQSNDVPTHLVEFAETSLLEFGEKPEIVGAVREHNALGLTLDEIKARDTAWRDEAGINRFMMNLMSNDCALAINNFENENRFIVETFVMDNQGANVGQSGKTSDYWQGDESKFTESYMEGSGAIHYGDIEYDDSADEIVIQVSVPVMDGEEAIGAITFGISLDRWERR
jgi:hypothetical protein